MSLIPVRVLGSELKAGDTIEVWWQPNRDTIVWIKPYTGRLAHLWSPQGVFIAEFALLGSTMTISSTDSFVRLASAPTAEFP